MCTPSIHNIIHFSGIQQGLVGWMSELGGVLMYCVCSTVHVLVALKTWALLSMWHRDMTERLLTTIWKVYKLPAGDGPHMTSVAAPWHT